MLDYGEGTEEIGIRKRVAKHMLPSSAKFRKRAEHGEILRVESHERKRDKRGNTEHYGAEPREAFQASLFNPIDA